MEKFRCKSLESDGGGGDCGGFIIFLSLGKTFFFNREKKKGRWLFQTTKTKRKNVKCRFPLLPSLPSRRDFFFCAIILSFLCEIFSHFFVVFVWHGNGKRWMIRKPFFWDLRLAEWWKKVREVRGWKKGFVVLLCSPPQSVSKFITRMKRKVT